MAADHPLPPFKYHEPGCKSNPFANQSNLKRHARSKHGPKATMPCGMKRSDHSSNNKRHEKSCTPCQQARGDAVSTVKKEEQTSPAHDGTGCPSDATEEVGVPFDFDPSSPYDPFWDLQHVESSF